MTMDKTELLDLLIDSARYGELDDVKTILATLKPEEIKKMVVEPNERNQMCLFMACANGHLDILNELLPFLTVGFGVLMQKS
jgi:ankyrin repeat protein